MKGFPPNWIEENPPRIDLYFNLKTEQFQYFKQTLMSSNQEWVAVADVLQQGAGNYVTAAVSANPEFVG